VLLPSGSSVRENPDKASLLGAALCTPWRTELWENAASQTLKAGDLEAAIVYLERANREAMRTGLPDWEAISLQSLEDLASAYIAVGDYPRALRTWQTIVARTSLTRRSAGELARLHLARGDFESALQVWQSFSELEPKDGCPLSGWLAAGNPPPRLRSRAAGRPPSWISLG
jgi:tetratricopeptide (TPR) repeat protein